MNGIREPFSIFIKYGRILWLNATIKHIIIMNMNYVCI